MTTARKRGRAGRRVASVARPLLAAGLLGALGWAAFQGVHRSADAGDAGRLADRAQITQAAAASVGAWLDAGLKESAAVATEAAQDGPAQAVAGYASGSHHVFREAFVADRSLHRLAGTQRYAASDSSLLSCRDARGAVLDDGLRRLIQAALDNGAAVVAGFDDPSCAPVVATAAPGPNGLVGVTIADRASLLVRLESLNDLANGRTYLIEPSGDVVGGAVAPASDELKVWTAARRSSNGAVSVAAQGVVRSWAALPGGWHLVVEQGANEFSGGGAPQPSNWFPALVAACFALAIVVVGLFDARRRRALARADEDRAAFLGVVGHELRTPLTVLKGFIETLSARWDQLQDAQRQSLIERLGPQVRRLHRGVDRLLIAAEIQRGANLRIEADPLDVADVVDKVVEGFRPLAPLHTFDVDVEPDLVAIADRKALAQALDQLVDNAVKYSPAGGAVVIGGRRRGRRVEVAIEDEGVGLPSDFSRVFEPLTQGEDVDTRVHDEGGIGVGLYIARALVGAMGGTIRAERRSPQPGTRLVVTLVAGPSRPGGREQLARAARVHGPS